MKKIFILLTLSIVLFAASSAFAANVRWKYAPFSGNLSQLQGQMTRTVNQGWTPVGISYINGQIWTLFVGSETVPVREWSIESYVANDGYSTRDGITRMMNQGFYPHGLSYSGNDNLMYVLYIKTSEYGSTWKLVRSTANLYALQGQIQPNANNFYLPVSVSAGKGYFYSLMVKSPNTRATGWALKEYRSDKYEITNGINSMIRQNYIPAGIMFRMGKTYIMYTQY